MHANVKLRFSIESNSVDLAPDQLVAKDIDINMENTTLFQNYDIDIMTDGITCFLHVHYIYLFEILIDLLIYMCIVYVYINC